MLTTLIAALLVTQSTPDIVPLGTVTELRSGKQVGWLLDAKAGLAFELDGPTALVVELRGDDSARSLAVEVIRDGAFVSTNTVELKPRPAGAPKGMPRMAKLSWQVPEGRHHYKLAAGGVSLGVFAKKLQAVERAVAAAQEVALAAGAAGAAKAASAPGASGAQPGLDALMDSGAAAASTVAASAADGQAKAIRVAVYDFEVSGVDPKIGAVVTDSFLSEVRKLQRVSAIGMDEIRDMLSHEANKQILGCEDNEACLAEIAGALGVDNLVSGTLSKVDDQHVLVVRRIDQNRAKVIGNLDRRLKAGSGQEFLAAVGPAIEELFAEFPLREGMTRGVPKEMALRLDPPPLPRWSFWAVAGTAVAVAAAGGLYGYLAREGEREFNDLFKADTVAGSAVVNAQTRAEDRASMANTLFISSGVVAAAAGVMALFTDWHGYGDAAAAPAK